MIILDLDIMWIVLTAFIVKDTR